MRPSEKHKRRVKESIQKVNDGYVLIMKVTIVSEKYNMELINYYVQYLEKKGFTIADRKYYTPQYDKNKIDVDFKETWHAEVL